MSPALLSMWVSISGLGMMGLSVVLIYLSRNKIKNPILKFILALIAYIFLIISGIIIFFIVVGGPTNS